MLKLYHGSNVIINEIDLCLSRKGKDFGCGFYLNPNESQAMEMAIRTTQRQKEGKPIVNTFLCVVIKVLRNVNGIFVS